MASSTDFKLLFAKYQADGVKQGISIVKYCQMNGVVYSHFERWYKKYRAGVVLPVEIVDESGLLDKSEVGSPSINIWFIGNVNDMRMGRRRLIDIVKDRFPNPYNGDMFAFMSKNRQLMKLVRYENRYLKWNVKII